MRLCTNTNLMHYIIHYFGALTFLFHVISLFHSFPFLSLGVSSGQQGLFWGQCSQRQTSLKLVISQEASHKAGDFFPFEKAVPQVTVGANVLVWQSLAMKSADG